MSSRVLMCSGWILAIGAVMAVPDGVKAADAPGVEASMVEFRGGAGPIKGFLARPRGDGPFPAIVVVHEWWGLTDWVKENAEKLAGQGYVALAVDLYGGKATNDPGVAHELMRALDDSEALADLKGAVAYLKGLPVVSKDRKFGAIGWCMGGKFSRLIGQGSDDIGPTVICYGSVSTESAQIEKLQDKPVLGIFGAEDQGIPVAKVKEFGRLLGAKAKVHVFDHAGHGFMRPGGNQYKADAATEAWKEITEFFAANLKS